MTTAVTDLVTGLVAIPFIVLLCHIKTGESRYGNKALWIRLFCFLSAASLIGFVAHAFIWNEHVKNIIWIFLYAVLFETARTFFMLSVCECIENVGAIRRLSTLIPAIEAVLYIVTASLPFFGINGIRIFVIYGIALCLPCFLMFAVKAIKQGHRGSSIFMLAFAPQLIGAVFQIARSGEFTLIWVFDYNSIYHLCLLASVVIFYFAAKDCIEKK